MTKKILWIASYPKSGNTWMRSILTSLFFTKNGKFSFDLLKLISIFENTERFEFVKEINKNDYDSLNKLEIISKYWIESQKRIEIDGDFIFLKTHHSCITYGNNPFTALNKIMGVIYLIRDPRDVAISYSKHMGKNIDDTIRIMKKKGTKNFYASPFKEKRNKFPALISSWDENIETWTNLKVPQIVIRYEDLLIKTEEIILEIVNFFEKNFNMKFHFLDEKINNIILTTNFDAFQKHEKKHGFSESTKNTLFFRKGKIGEWKKILTDNQIKQLENSFGILMKKYNYL